jgi:hypothetical protein
MQAIDTEANISLVRQPSNAELRELTASELEYVSGASVAGDVASAATRVLHVARGICEGMAEGLVGFVIKTTHT